MACIFRNILLKALPVAALALNLAACETSRPAANIEARTEAVFASIEQTRRAHELEEQIVARLDASPFEVGPLGSALLDLDSDNLVAHLGLAVFYDAVKEPRKRGAPSLDGGGLGGRH